jgi:hypothetical protein
VCLTKPEFDTEFGSESVLCCMAFGPPPTHWIRFKRHTKREAIAAWNAFCRRVRK